MKARYPIAIAAAMLAMTCCARAGDSLDAERVAAIAVLGKIAPACGVRSVRWGNDLYQGLAGLVQATLPRNPFSSEFLADFTRDEAFVGAAYDDGGFIIAEYGKAKCGDFTVHDLRDADGVVKTWRSGNRKMVMKPDMPAGIPEGAVKIAWQNGIAEMALKCHVRTGDWSDQESVAVSVGAETAAGAFDKNSTKDHRRDRLIATIAVLKIDDDLGKLQVRAIPRSSCAMVRNSPELKTIDAEIKALPPQANPWAGVKP